MRVAWTVVSEATEMSVSDLRRVDMVTGSRDGVEVDPNWELVSVSVGGLGVGSGSGFSMTADALLKIAGCRVPAGLIVAPRFQQARFLHSIARSQKHQLFPCASTDARFFSGSTQPRDVVYWSLAAREARGGGRGNWLACRTIRHHEAGTDRNQRMTKSDMVSIAKRMKMPQACNVGNEGLNFFTH